MREMMTSQALTLADNLTLPRAMVTHVVGILAMRGMGKSYLASVLMEEMVSQGLFVGFVDPLGIAWGIRSSADGEHDGLNVLIFGGRHGDVPLDPSAGKIVAQAVLEMRQAFILDLSLFDTEDEQRAFIADFIEAFRPCENVLLHVIVDEADIFAPQTPQSAEANRSLRAMSALARRFRYKGIGATFICQRPAELHKGVMQFDLLLALCITQPHDIKAVDTWIKHNATVDERAAFLATLANLPVGNAWAWSPRWLQMFERVTIRTRYTYDSSRTPDVDSIPVVPKRLAEIDLSVLSAQIEALMARTKETDPTYLQQRIRELEGQLRTTASPTVRLAPATKASVTTQHELAQARQHLAEKNQEIQHLRLKIAELAKFTVSVNGSMVPLVEVPSQLQRLHIDTATITVGQLTSAPEDAPSSHSAAAPRSPTGTPPGRTLPQVAQHHPVEPEASVGGLSSQEQLTLSRLLKKIGSMPPNERALFTWLLNHDQQPWIVAETLAAVVCISKRATKRDRTLHLAKIEFIQRDGTRFRANFAEYANAAFGSANNLQAVKQALLEAAR